MSRLEIALLGPPGIKVNGDPVKTDRRKAIALLAYLAVTAKSHSREQLATLLWPDYEQGSAYAYLRRTLWELNQMMGKGWIEADRERAAFVQRNDTWLDTAAFLELKQNGSDGITALADAVNLYRGDFLDGFIVADTAPFEDWQRQQAEYFRLEFANALEKLVEAYVQAGAHETALPYARRWLALDRLNESAHCAIMRILASSGDRTGAIRQYESCAQTLKVELGIDPQPETTRLYEAILQGDISGRHPISGVTQTIESGSSEIKKPVLRLPVMPTPFIGRRTEVEQVKSLVLDPALRLITLAGPGGIGKTRLSIQAASEVGEAFPDGVFFASLTPVRTAEGIVPAVAKALDFSFYREKESPRQQLLDYLCGRQMLLIMDNFEHMIGSGARKLAGEVLSAAPGVKLLVTSRVQLNVQGEQLYPLGGMHIAEVEEAGRWDKPEEQAKPFSAVQLFLDRARRVLPGFALTKENVTPVIEICQLVRGMPLGLELAAAWVELLSPVEIVAEITRSLDFLETDQVDVPDRQRSLRSVFDSSWRLLSDTEREAFLRLCVFVGNFSREAAQQVTGASLRTLLGLANKSFLQKTDVGRYQLHELMRQFGEEQLKADVDEWQEAHDRHAAYFTGFVTDQSLRMQSPEQFAGFSALEDEFDTNIKAAWDWLVSERRWNELIENMLPGLFQFGLISWQTDVLLPWFRAVRLSLASDSTSEERLALAIFSTLEVYCEEDAHIKDADTSERISLIWRMADQNNLAEKMGFWHVILANLVRARNLAFDVDEALEYDISRLREQKSMWQLGMSVFYQATWMSMHIHDGTRLPEAASIFEELGVFYEQGLVAEKMRVYAWMRRRPLAEVTGYYNQARHFYQKLNGHIPRTGITLDGLGDFYFLQGKYEQGFDMFEEEKRELERMGQMRALEFHEHWESLYAARYSTYEHALRLRQHNIELIRKLGSQSDLAWRWFELGDVYRIFGEPDKALPLYERSQVLFEKLNMVLGLGFHQRACGDLALDSKRYSDALEHYKKFEAYAREDSDIWAINQSRGKIALANAYLGDIEQARREMGRALAQTYAYHEDDLALESMLAEAVCLLKEGSYEDVIELASYLQHHPASWNETRQHARAILETASSELDQEVVLAAVERGKVLDFDTLIAKLTK